METGIMLKSVKEAIKTKKTAAADFGETGQRNQHF